MSHSHFSAFDLSAYNCLEQVDFVPVVIGDARGDAERVKESPPYNPHQRTIPNENSLNAAPCRPIRPTGPLERV